MAGKYLGDSSIISFGGTALEQDYRTIDINESIGLVDKSAGSDAHESFLAAKVGTTVAIEFLFDGTEEWAAAAPGTEDTLIYGPEGSTSGDPKYTAVAIVESRQRKGAYNDVSAATVNLRMQASWLEGTY